MGRKPSPLARHRSLSERHRQAHANFLKRVSPMLEAQRYVECLSRASVSTKAQVAEVFGVSRPRVTQCMNLLKLPREIQDYLLDHNDDPVVRGYFTERRLRPLTYLEAPEDAVARFGEMIEEATEARSVWSA
jgi:hypothetical protein